MSTQITYNLPGYGFATCNLFPTANALINVLDGKGLIEKSKNICQLGTMKYVYPGAHHTRYEYIFTQLMLTSNITINKGQDQRNIELPLGSKLNELKDYDIKPTGGDIMQCLAILNNVGHMYDTFSSSKMIVKLLRESRTKKTAFYKIYKTNLPKELYDSFEHLLDTNNYYKLHQYNMIHLLKGMLRTKESADICKLGIKILSMLIKPDLIKNEATKRVYHLYKKIRKIAYLSVDMIYTPASFGANLSRMIYSISSYVDDLFDEDSPMNKSILQLEDIIHKQIYDSPICILSTTKIEQDSYNKYFEAINNIDNIYLIRKMIYEKEEPFRTLHSEKEPDILRRIIPNSYLFLSGVNDSNRDLIFENAILQKIPSSNIAFGIQTSQNLKKTYAAFGLLNKCTICHNSQIVIKKSIKNRLFDENEKIELVKYAIKSIYRYNEFFFQLTSPSEYNNNECVIIGNGCKFIAREIRRKYVSIDNADDKHEIISCAKVLDSISYTGLVLCYVGGIKASKINETQKIDEIDGFIYFPERNLSKTFAIIVEAKNYCNGEVDAEKQLKDTIPFITTDLETEIKKLSKCAYLEIKKKNNF